MSEESPLYIGIDPGAAGGMALLGKRMVLSVKMPETDKDIWEWLTEYTGGRMRPFAVIEKVGGFIAGNPSPGSAMFNFGTSYGALRMALTAAKIPFEEVIPRTWQKGLGIPSRKPQEKKTVFKRRLREHAQKLFPDINVTLATADALLIAEFCRRKRTGQLK